MNKYIIIMLICLVLVAGCSEYSAVEKEAIDSCTSACFELKEFQSIYTKEVCQGKCVDHFAYGGIEEVQQTTTELKSYKDNLVKTRASRDLTERNVNDLNQSLEMDEQVLVSKCSNTCRELNLIYVSEQRLGNQCWLGCYDILLSDGVSGVEQDIIETQSTLNDIHKQ